jgi:DNA-binding response OmpR family regulator
MAMAGDGEGDTVLLFEDDQAMARLIPITLRSDGIAVDVLTTDDAGALAHREPRDVVVIDLPFEYRSGLNVLTAARNAWDRPCVVITEPRPEDELVECLRAGAFDLLFKPFTPDDLAYCVRLALGRPTAPDPGPSMRVARMQIDLASRRLTRDGNPETMSLSEWRLLDALAGRLGSPVLYQELISRAWGPEYRSALRFLDAWMARLKRHVAVEEFHGVGYVLQPTG